jgi:acetyl esterase/lipase
VNFLLAFSFPFGFVALLSVVEFLSRCAFISSSQALFYTGPAVQSEAILSQQPPEPDSRLSYGTDPSQFADVRLPAGKGPHPVVFFIHGGFWRAKYDLIHAGHLCHALKNAGVATWNVEYRRVGNPGGGWPGSFEDIRSAYRALIRQSKDTGTEFDLSKGCVAGHSAGGQLAMCLAAHEPTVKRVLSLAGALDLRRVWDLHLSNDAVAQFLGGSPTEVPDHYREASPAQQKIPGAAQKIVHGTEDMEVPYEISRSYAEHKQKSGERVELVTLPRTGHYEIVDPAAAVWSKIQDLFLSLTG